MELVDSRHQKTCCSICGRTPTCQRRSPARRRWARVPRPVSQRRPSRTRCGRTRRRRSVPYQPPATILTVKDPPPACRAILPRYLEYLCRPAILPPRHWLDRIRRSSIIRDWLPITRTCPCSDPELAPPLYRLKSILYI